MLVGLFYLQSIFYWLRFVLLSDRAKFVNIASYFTQDDVNNSFSNSASLLVKVIVSDGIHCEKRLTIAAVSSFFLP